MAGAESIEEGREGEEVGCGCGGVGLSLLWLVAGLGPVACCCCCRHGGKMSNGHSLTLDSTSTDCIRDVVGFAS